MEQHHPLAMALALVIVLVIAYLTARKPRRKADDAGERQGLSRRELKAIMKHRAQDAVGSAKAEFGKTLDFLPESVLQVEEILAALHERHAASPFDSERLTQETTKWGAYVGEVLKQVYPSEWRQDSAEAGSWSLPLVEIRGGAEVFPVAWVRQRIVEGPERNVWERFCLFVLERVQGPA